MKQPLGKKVIVWLICGLLVMLGFYGFLVEPRQFRVNHVQIPYPKMRSILKKKIVIQISDLHLNGNRFLEDKILTVLDGLNPDFIFLTGDYVRWDGDYEAALNFLSRVKARIGVWAIMGDYDYSNSRKSCLFCHEKDSGKFTQRHRVHFLKENYEKIKLEEGVFWIGGIDYTENHDEFLKETKILSNERKLPVMILSHNPLVFDKLDNTEDVFILAGDTHGGQVHLPGWLWKIMGYRKNALYNYGFFKRGQKKMFVSRGVGTSHIPLRVCSPPEVVVLHFY
jgi:hypothetical protein